MGSLTLLTFSIILKVRNTEGWRAKLQNQKKNPFNSIIRKDYQGYNSSFTLINPPLPSSPIDNPIQAMTTYVYLMETLQIPLSKHTINATDL